MKFKLHSLTGSGVYFILSLLALSFIVKRYLDRCILKYTTSLLPPIMAHLSRILCFYVHIFALKYFFIHLTFNLINLKKKYEYWWVDNNCSRLRKVFRKILIFEKDFNISLKSCQSALNSLLIHFGPGQIIEG